MVSPPSMTSKWREEQGKKKEEARKLQRKQENQILKNVGITKNNQRYTKKRTKKENPSRSRRIEMPPRTEQAIVELLEKPIEGSPLNPVTELTLVSLTILQLNSEMLLPVIDLF